MAESTDIELLQPLNLSKSSEMLLLAAEEGYLEVFEELLGNNPELIHTTDSNGETALHRASYFNRPRIVASCIESGADMEARTNDGWTPLHSACCKNSVVSIRGLLLNGANVNAQTKTGQTPLHITVSYPKCRESLTLLISHPALNVDIVNNKNQTAYDLTQKRDARIAGFSILTRKSFNGV